MRYGAMITCFAIIAIHTEIINSTETDSFTLAVRGFIERCGYIRSITSGNGTNLVGANNKLKKAFNKMNHQPIQHFLANTVANWLIWSRNAHATSHMGGV